MKNSLRLFALSALPVAIASAQTPATQAANPITLSNVVVSAAHLGQDASEVYNGVSVITRADLDRLQATNILDVLQTVPGVSFYQSGGKGSLSGFFIRGTKSAQTLVLIDGVRAASAASGAAALETLSVDQIERIEVIRGSRSSQYGADAIGGVIQIFTRQATQDGLSLRAKVGFGNYGASEQSLGASFQNRDTQASINLSHEAMTGHNRSRSEAAANKDDDAFRNTAMSVNLSHKLSQDVKLSLSHLQQEGETEYDFGWAGSYPYDEFKINNTRVALDWAVNSLWSTRVEIGNNQNDNINRYDDTAYYSFFRTDRDQAQWLNTLDFGRQQWQLGLDVYTDELQGSTTFAETARDNHAAFAQYRFGGERISAEAGVRVDDNDVYGNFESFNLGAGIKLDSANNLFVSVNQAFRAPNFTELYYPGYDNPNLTPEESQSVEVKLTHALNPSANLSASVYHTDIDDAIINNAYWIPHNIGEVEIEGAEVEYRQQLNAWLLTATASYVDARDTQTGNFLNRRPKKTLNLDISRRINDWTLGASVYGSGASWEDTAATRKLAGYALVNLRATYQISESLTAALKVDNLLDTDYATAVSPEWTTHYRELGRSAFLSLTWTPAF